MIRVTDLQVNYDSKIALADVTFDVCKGDYLAIVGENGSGKSTLLKTILGLKKPNKGIVEFSDKLKLGYLPQMDESMKDFPATVIEIIKMGYLNKMNHHICYPKKAINKVYEVMEKLNISDLKKKYFKNLSGGQRQRVLLARALVASDELLILDEPTTGLDPIATLEFYNELDRLNHEGLTIITVTHDVKTAVSCASKILHLNQKVLFFGSKEDYLSSDLFKLFGEVHLHDR